MAIQTAFVFAVILGALVFFIIERFRADQVAIAIPAVLLLGGVISAADAVSGFSSPATVTVASMLVLSLGLRKTGAVSAVARWALAAPLGKPWLRLLVLCLVAAAVSPFLNNTAVVVVFLPIFLAMAQRADEPASLYLMPLSFAAILGGTVTLIGTSTNLIVYGMAESRGFGELNMFSIAPLGLIYLVVGMTYLFTVGRRLLPHRKGLPDLSRKYGLRDFLTELAVAPGSPAVGKTLAELGWRERYGVSVLGILRSEQEIWAPGARRYIRHGDVVYVRGHSDQLLKLARRERLFTPAERIKRPEPLHSKDTRLVEVLVARGSPLAGRTLRQVHFQQRYDATVVAIQHLGVSVSGPLADARLEAGDLMLVHGPVSALEALADERGFIPLSEVEGVKPRPRAIVAVMILLAVVGVAGTGLVSIVEAALVGTVLMVLSGCVKLDEVYRELDWMVVFLLAGLIPLGVAMDNTGAAEWLAQAITGHIGPLGPAALVASFYLLTSVLTSIISNSAAAVVLTPVALVTAVDVGMNPYALLVAVMFGASASFMTPVGYQTNTLIYGPGGYRFADFVRVGTPLNILLMATATLLIPIFWPS